MKNTNLTNRSPFHKGEQIIQEKFGKRQQVESFAKQALRSFMPEQHQNFFAQLPFVIAGSVDEQSNPWASIIVGKPGFMYASSANQLKILHNVKHQDPLYHSISRSGAAIGLLGIELHTRRRNRLNVRVNGSSTNKQATLDVDQSFGNCPQYIQTRTLHFKSDPSLQNNRFKTITFNTLDTAAQTLIDNADTFFVASFIDSKNNPQVEGVDVSHRGGMPGFIKREGDNLTIPDYSGNFMFNTLGNFLLNPKAGLLFVDFTSTDVLMLTGSVEILWDDHPVLQGFKGAQRAWRFKLTKGIWLKSALPFSAEFNQYSPNALLTGTWREAEQLKQADKLKNTWQPLKVVKIKRESDNIYSFYFQHRYNQALASFKAGQHLTLQLPEPNNSGPIFRNYTVSSSPDDNFYKISIKQQANGLASQYFHNEVKVGDVILAKYPRGQFYLDSSNTRPVVLIGGGIGITPMLSMATHMVNEQIKTRNFRPLHIFHGAKNAEQRAFYQDFKQLQQTSNGFLNYYSILSQPSANSELGIDFDIRGRINKKVLREHLLSDDCAFYLCGPAAFMQQIYDTLLTLGVADQQVFAEGFGPSELNRKISHKQAFNEKIESNRTLIHFTDSKLKRVWNKGDEPILNLAEAHGLTPEFSCRNGSCGSCLVKINKGKVVYRKNISYPVLANEALVCCAVPAKGVDVLAIEL